MEDGIWIVNITKHIDENINEEIKEDLKLLLIVFMSVFSVSRSFCFHCCRADLSVVGILGRRLEVARCGRRRHEAAV